MNENLNIRKKKDLEDRISKEMFIGWVQENPLAAFFGLTYLISRGLGLTNDSVFNRGQFLWMPFASLATCALGLFVILITSLSSKRDRIGTIRRFWLIFATFTLTGIIFLSMLVSSIFGRTELEAFKPDYQGWTLFKFMGITFIYLIFFYNLTGDEIGWRGFALPRLHTKVSPFIANLILTVTWSWWHAFCWGTLGDSVLTLGFLWNTFVRLFPAIVVVIIAWPDLDVTPVILEPPRGSR
jgi:membrane protease YdiL (CAAX protease family)